jgi:hypothetical protein
VNISQAVAAKLQGKKIDCRQCHYWASLYSSENTTTVFACAKTLEVKTDRVMCDSFKSRASGHYSIHHGGIVFVYASELDAVKRKELLCLLTPQP